MKLFVSTSEGAERLGRVFFWFCVGMLVLSGVAQGKYGAVAAALGLLALLSLARRFAPNKIQPSSRIGNTVAPLLAGLIIGVIALAWWLSRAP